MKASLALTIGEGPDAIRNVVIWNGEQDIIGKAQILKEWLEEQKQDVKLNDSDSR